MSSQGVEDEESGEPEAVEDVFSALDADLSLEEFRKRVEMKVEQMGGLCDEVTAAKLVSHEIGGKQVYKIDDVHADLADVQFVGKVTKIGEPRSFDRDDGSEGQVANVEVADETGRVRVSLWDEYAESIDELSEGDVLKIAGTPKEGWNGGVEVSASQVEPTTDVEVDVVEDAANVEEIQQGMDGVSLEARVLSVSGMNTFDRDDGSEGRVANLVVGDQTGWMRITMWDERAPEAGNYSAGDCVRVVNGYAKERDGSVELHVGSRGRVERIDEEIEFDPDVTPIEMVELDEVCDVAGVITDTGELRTFDRDDGSEGRVRNVRVRDETGELRVALWGEHADREFAPGDEVVLTGVEIKEGWNGGMEGSLNWNSTVTVVEGGVRPEAGQDEGEEEQGSRGLDSFT